MFQSFELSRLLFDSLLWREKECKGIFIEFQKENNVCNPGMLRLPELFLSQFCYSEKSVQKLNSVQYKNVFLYFTQFPWQNS